MAKQEAVYVGRAGGWHNTLNQRVKFAARLNGQDCIVVGKVKRVSPTGAILKISAEHETHNGKLISRIIEVPTDVVKEGSLRVLRDGEQA